MRSLVIVLFVFLPVCFAAADPSSEEPQQITLKLTSVQCELMGSGTASGVAGYVQGFGPLTLGVPQVAVCEAILHLAQQMPPWCGDTLVSLEVSDFWVVGLKGYQVNNLNLPCLRWAEKRITSVR